MNWENIDRKKDSITYLIGFEKKREVLKAVAKERKKTSILEDRERDRDEETETQTGGQGRREKEDEMFQTQKADIVLYETCSLVFSPEPTCTY